MAGFVIGDGFLLFRGDDIAAPLQSTDNSVNRRQEILFLDKLFVLRDEMRRTGQKIILPMFVVGVGIFAFARAIVVPPVPMPEFADTEVSTNMPFRADNASVREMNLRFVLSDGAVSCIQVAFGRDANSDGILDVDESETLFGLRNGRCVAENKTDGLRFEEEASATSRVFSVNFRLSRRHGLRSFAAADETGTAIFTNLSSSVQGWLYNPEWNMMRVTRRGPGVPDEWFSCDLRSHFFLIKLK